MKKLPAIIFCTIIAILIIIADADNTRSGDEVITYGMANSYYQGWMLSNGRVGDYLKNRIIDDDVKTTMHNLLRAGNDVLKNRSQAEYFSYPRPKESGWYTQSEIKDWFTISEKEKFSYASTYVNALSDNANSFLYNALVHTISSFAGEYGDSKWCAFSINIFFVCAIYWLMAKISGLFGLNGIWSYIPGLFWGISYSCIYETTNYRAYIMSMFWATLLLYVHKQFWDNYKTEKCRKECIKIWIVYLIGYISHYTMGIWLCVLGANTLIYLVLSSGSDKRKYILHYVLTDVLAVGCGLLLAPLSLVGLLSKLLNQISNGDGGGGFKGVLENIFDQIRMNVFYNSITQLN